MTCFRFFLGLGLVVLSSGTAMSMTEVNNRWQVEAGADYFSNSNSGGLASATFGSLGFERQDLENSETGIRIGARKNFDLQNGFFTNSGVAVSFNSHEHEINLRQILAKVERESDTRNLSFEQRFGYSYRPFENVILRPFMGVGMSIMQTETTSSVIDNAGNRSPEQPTSTVQDTFFYPSVGLEAYYKDVGLSISYFKTQLTTPSANIITGNTNIEEGFDLLSIFNVSLLYSF